MSVSFTKQEWDKVYHDNHEWQCLPCARDIEKKKKKKGENEHNSFPTILGPVNKFFFSMNKFMMYTCTITKHVFKLRITVFFIFVIGHTSFSSFFLYINLFQGNPLKVNSLKGNSRSFKVNTFSQSYFVVCFNFYPG